MKFNKIFALAVAASVCLVQTSCFSGSGVVSRAKTIMVDLKSSAIPSNQYQNLTKGLRVEVSSSVSESRILDYSNLDSKLQKYYANAEIVVDPQIKPFVTNTMTSYMRSMGINVGRDVDNDLVLQIKINEFKYVYAGNGGRAVVEFEYTLMNSDREVILRQVSRGRKSTSGEGTVSSALDKAYSDALADMDWDGITNYLKINKRADQEQQRSVKGDGDTALEHTVIRWYVVSSPAGADVYWRIVSSTPEVKNTNSTYLGTTPYEATESFSVKGLSFENSGNVQVEIVCEKAGYLTQTRRFNLRQAIEQREISTKFNLIKEE